MNNTLFEQFGGTYTKHGDYLFVPTTSNNESWVFAIGEDAQQAAIKFFKPRRLKFSTKYLKKLLSK